MKKALTVPLIALAATLSGEAHAESSAQPVVRIAQLEIDPAHLESYQAAVKEEITTSLRVEPGVLTLYCVADRDRPNQLHFFEVYANPEAYRSHIASAHFQKYARLTQSMILSKRLIDTVPVQMDAKTGDRS